MSGLRSRNKGKRGEREAVHLLEERGYEIVELGPGRKQEDVLAELDGKRVSVEVKNCVVWHIQDWRKQAKTQAKKRGCAWLLLCRVPGMPGTFYVEGEDRTPCVWRGNAAKQVLGCDEE